MLIGIDASGANKTNKTGIEWYSYHLIQEFKKIADQNDQFILYSREELKGELGKLPSNWQSKVLRWPFSKFWTQARLSWEFFVNKPDIFFAPSNTLPIIHPKKTITTCHDLGFYRVPHAYRRVERIIQKIGFFILKKGASKIIAVSNFTKQELMKFSRIGGDKIKVVYNGYDKERYKEIKDKSKVDEVLAKYNLKRPYVLYVGRLEFKKNTPNLVRAFDILKEKFPGIFHKSSLVLVGSKGFGHSIVQDEIKRSNLRNKVILPGWISEEDLPYIISGAELFCYPSLYEGFGIPLLEAMALGVPVLASDILVLREIVEEGAHFVDPTSPEKISEGMGKILKDHNFKSILRERGLEQVEKFSWETCARETLKVMKEGTL